MSENDNMDWEDDYGASRRRLIPHIGRFGFIGLVTVIGAVALYYLAGMVLVHRISDDIEFQASVPAPGASRAVAISAALIERETDRNRWTANDPIMLPGHLLDNMPNFQQGIIYALSRFVIEMADHIGRSRGSSEVDPDLDKAAGLLKYPGNIWIFDFSTSLAPTASSEAQYRAARRSLLAYNDRLVSGQAIFERRADNLQATLERITADLGSSSAVIDQHLASPPPFIDTQADNIFYNVKGRLYGYYLLLRELGADYGKVMTDRDLSRIWGQMLDSLRSAAMLDPLVVVNGAPDGLYLPSHLAVQGFYLLRARTQLREIVNVLQK
ncbi:MAG: DUF2333 family protein [Rhodospirillaceae bacterium]|jgi:hypothetical protein|nr:DUF2333 family protein [Rhodospirillaceae bacterium]MBT6138531.1 DUF2333 family protein [Rhodospirillaceae bacterium]